MSTRLPRTTNRIKRTHKKEPLIHINIYVSKKAHEYFDQKANLSEGIRTALDEYVDIMTRTPNEESEDESN